MRIDHMGASAFPDAVFAAIVALGAALRHRGRRVDVSAAVAAAGEALL
jgi:aspartate aminotransferase-like enzyme